MDETTSTTPLRIHAFKYRAAALRWKTKAKEYRRRERAAGITVRDLTRSRTYWKQQAHDAQTQLDVLQQQLHATQQQLQQANDALERAAAEKKHSS